MSHVVRIETRMKDAAAITAACAKLGLAKPVQGTARLFTSQATGLIVQLPEWTYPVVIDTQTGKLAYDNYAGTWGSPVHLDRLLQAYAVEKVRIEARKTGNSLTEQKLPDGSVKLTISVGGAA